MTDRTVIFDLDGTLLNTLDDLTDSANFALAKNGLPQRTWEDFRRFIGGGVAALIRRAVPDKTSFEQTEQCLDDFRVHYLANMQNKTAPYPGVWELLSQLKACGCRMAVVSNKPDQAAKQLCRHYFGDLLPIVIGEIDGLRKKPAPDLLVKCLEELDATAKESVYVGDSEFDIQTAANASLPCISACWGYRDRAFLTERGAEVTVDTPEQLLALIVG